MLASVDPFLARRHRGKTYNCKHYVRDAWLAHTGDDIETRLAALYAPEPAMRKSEIGRFERLPQPRDPCIVLFRRKNDNHVGMFLRGKVLHLRSDGARYEPLEMAKSGFRDVRFYR